jgi:hypothetical protein
MMMRLRPPYAEMEGEGPQGSSGFLQSRPVKQERSQLRPHFRLGALCNGERDDERARQKKKNPGSLEHISEHRPARAR